jgi:glycerol kinase
MDLHTLDWDAEPLDPIGAPRAMPPQIRSSSEIYGTASGVLEGVPVAGDLGDQRRSTRSRGRSRSPERWYSGCATLASTIQDNGGMYLVPAFLGLFAPYQNNDARRVTVGMTRYVNKGHFAPAALEATAFQTREVVEAMQTDSGVKLTALKVDGRMVYNDMLMQFQSDILGVPVIRPRLAETTALSAAYAAGLATGVWSNLEELRHNWAVDKMWEPSMDGATRERLYHDWKRAVERSSAE